MIILLFFTLSATDDTLIYKNAINNEKKIALSFDDGPHPTQTPRILAILDKHDIKATFFVIGKNATAYPDILRQVCEEGHEIGNHTNSHIKAMQASDKELLVDIKKGHECILNLCEYDTKLFRPPGGIITPKITDISTKLNYKIILWDIDTKDWAHPSVDSIKKNVLSNVKSGSIILFHDYISKNAPTAEALNEIIPLLKEEGYSFVTVGELINCERSASLEKE